MLPWFFLGKLIFSVSSGGGLFILFSHALVLSYVCGHIFAISCKKVIREVNVCLLLLPIILYKFRTCFMPSLYISGMKLNCLERNSSWDWLTYYSWTTVLSCVNRTIVMFFTYNRCWHVVWQADSMKEWTAWTMCNKKAVISCQFFLLNIIFLKHWVLLLVSLMER